MQRLVNAIDKGVRGGVFTLEETASYIQALDHIGRIVKDHNDAKAEPVKPSMVKVNEKK